MAQSKALRAAVKRTEATTVIEYGAGDVDRPDYLGADYVAMQEDVQYVRTVYGGTKTMRAAGKEMLPIHPMEQEAAWKRRRDRAVLYNQLKRAVGGLVGMVLRKDPVLEDVPPAILADLDNIDQMGSDLPTFVKALSDDAMVDGLAWIHVEYPTPSEDVRTLRDARDVGIRPYWVHVPFSEAINWRFEFSNGKPRLTLFVYREAREVEKGAYGTAEEVCYRVLRPGSWEIWKKVKDDEGREGWQMVEDGVTTLSYIPVYPVFGRRTGPFRAEPPLLDVAYENVEHYQVRSDYRHALSFASQPIPWVIGMDPEGKLGWGSGQMLTIESVNAKVGVLESSGIALQASRDELKDIEGRIAVLSLAMLLRNTGEGREKTATEISVDKAEGDSELATFARGLQASLNMALQAHADFRDLEPGYITVNRDFSSLVISPQLAQSLHQMVQTGDLSQETMWRILQTWEVLPEDFDPDDERAALDASLSREVEALAAAGRPDPMFGDEPSEN